MVEGKGKRGGGSTRNIEEARAELLRELAAVWPKSPGWPSLSEECASRFSLYAEELWRWNRTLNLTRLTSPKEVAHQHILDSAQALPYLRGTSLLDIGSGAGLPGLVLAILRPDMYVTLLDARAKRVEFLSQVIRKLGLPNACAEHGRWPLPAADFRRFDTFTSRATFSDVDSLFASGTMPASGACTILWRTEPWAGKAGWVSSAVAYALPGLHHPRYLQIVEEERVNG